MGRAAGSFQRFACERKRKGGGREFCRTFARERSRGVLFIRCGEAGAGTKREHNSCSETSKAKKQVTTRRSIQSGGGIVVRIKVLHAVVSFLPNIDWRQNSIFGSTCRCKQKPKSQDMPRVDFCRGANETGPDNIPNDDILVMKSTYH